MRLSAVCLALSSGPALLAGCAPGCPLGGQHNAAETRLFFGRDIQGGGFVTDAAWSAFARTILTPAFPDGFTIYDATGQWQSPRDGRITREKTVVVEIVGPTAPDRVESVTESYRSQFHQDSVGVVTGQVCARF